MNGAQWLVHRLQIQGIDTVFGYPGGAIMPVYDALYDGGIRHILCRHEQGAAMAAIGYARASGKTGVCIATSGPGATNLITGLADALLDSVPLVAITGQVASPLIGTDAFQEVDVLGLSLACTKHSFLVQSAKALPQILSEAFQLAASGRPGPVLVDIPKDIQQADYPFEPWLCALPTPPAPGDGQLALALALLAGAQKPVLYVGGGVGMAGAVAALDDFLSASQIPVVTTLKGQGAVAEDYPYYPGMIGMHGAPAANHLVQQCDLLIAVGTRFDDRVTGKLESFAPHAKVLHLDIDPAEFNKLRHADVALAGDLTALLGQLQSLWQPSQLQASQLQSSQLQSSQLQSSQLQSPQPPSAQLPSAQQSHNPPPPNITPWRQTALALMAQYPWRYDFPGEGIYAPLLLKQLSDLKPADTVITTDVGQHQMWAAQHMRVCRPENFITSSGLGTMGFGLPAAIGAQLARPQSLVLCVSGDGSFMMNVQELATVRRNRLPIKIILLDNQRLGMVRQWQQLFFDQRYSETTLDDNPDFVALAKIFDIDGQRIHRQAQILPALQTLLAHPGAYLLHVVINELDNVWPLVPPGASNAHMLENHP